MTEKITESMLTSVHDFIGTENVRWFAHVKGLKGSVSAVLKLNFKKKHMPAHPIHLREGMQIRNHMRRLPECSDWDDQDFDIAWVYIMNELIERLKSGEI